MAAAFAAWVAESPLTGPGAGGFALVAPADGRPARVADFFVATPGRGAPVPGGAEMHAIDIGFGGDSDTTQVFRIGEPSCAVPGAAAGLEDGSPGLWTAAVGRIVATCDRGFPGAAFRSRGRRRISHNLLDLILRHTAEGRRVYSRPDGGRLQPGDELRLPDLGETLERISVEGVRAVYEGELGARSSTPSPPAAARIHLARGAWRATRSSGGGPVRSTFLGHELVSNPPPSSGGVLIAYGLALLERLGMERAGKR